MALVAIPGVNIFSNVSTCPQSPLYADFKISVIWPDMVCAQGYNPQVALICLVKLLISLKDIIWIGSVAANSLSAWTRQIKICGNSAGAMRATSLVVSAL